MPRPRQQLGQQPGRRRHLEQPEGRSRRHSSTVRVLLDRLAAGRFFWAAAAGRRIAAGSVLAF